MWPSPVAVIDHSRVSGVSDRGLFGRAIEFYDKAAASYERDPMVMSAYVQMINCYLRMGDPVNAQRSLERAKWALARIPDIAFSEQPTGEDRAYWQKYLAWLGDTPTFELASAQP